MPEIYPTSHQKPGNKSRHIASPSTYTEQTTTTEKSMNHFAENHRGAAEGAMSTRVRTTHTSKFRRTALREPHEPTQAGTSSFHPYEPTPDISTSRRTSYSPQTNTHIYKRPETLQDLGSAHTTPIRFKAAPKPVLFNKRIEQTVDQIDAPFKEEDVHLLDNRLEEILSKPSSSRTRSNSDSSDIISELKELRIQVAKLKAQKSSSTTPRDISNPKPINSIPSQYISPVSSRKVDLSRGKTVNWLQNITTASSADGLTSTPDELVAGPLPENDFKKPINKASDDSFEQGMAAMDTELKKSFNSIKDINRNINILEVRAEETPSQPPPYIRPSSSSINITIGLPRLWTQDPAKRLGVTFTWLGLILLIFLIWFVTETITCEYFCHPLYASTPVYWSYEDPFYPYAIPTKLDQWTGKVVSRGSAYVGKALEATWRGWMGVEKKRPMGLMRAG